MTYNRSKSTEGKSLNLASFLMMISSMIKDILKMTIIKFLYHLQQIMKKMKLLKELSKLLISR